MEETVTIIGNTCLKHHDSGEASVNREARLIIQALKEKGYEIILMPTTDITSNDFEKIIAEELKNDNGYNAHVKCFQLYEQGIAKLKAELEGRKTYGKTLEHFQNEIAKKNGFKNYDRATSMADTDEYHKINFEAEQAFEEYKNGALSNPISDKPFATWLKTNNYFKSKKGEKKTYENKFIEGIFTRKVLYKKFKGELSKQVEKKVGEVALPKTRICDMCGCPDGIHKSNCSYMRNI